MTASGGMHYIDAAAPAGMRIYAIGDVHGRLDCLTRMHDIIAAEIARDRPADWRVIHLGDYVDRGPESACVIDFLSGMIERDGRNLALLGNHDEGFLDFLANPAEAQLFIRFGGFDTAASYGVVLDVLTEDALFDSHRRLVNAMPERHLRFLRDRPRSVSFGDFFFCHAGIRPGVPLDAQEPHDLIWIRREFLNHAGLHDKVIVHGHTPVGRPEVMPNRVDVDTMAFDTGRLTALVIDGREKRFVEAVA